jgi:hypothetical protein
LDTVQAAPAARRSEQVPPLHQYPFEQSPSPAQDVLQLVGPHRYGEQDAVAPLWHTPDPLQVPALVSMPVLQEALEHVVPDA